jgi:hypothetical protein
LEKVGWSAEIGLKRAEQGHFHRVSGFFTSTLAEGSPATAAYDRQELLTPYVAQHHCVQNAVPAMVGRGRTQCGLSTDPALIQSFAETLMGISALISALLSAALWASQLHITTFSLCDRSDAVELMPWSYRFRSQQRMSQLPARGALPARCLPPVSRHFQHRAPAKTRHRGHRR